MTWQVFRHDPDHLAERADGQSSAFAAAFRLVESPAWWTRSGRTERPAGTRGPHSGFPAWRPSDSRTEALDEAVSWAARSGAVEAITWLAMRGADLDADVYRGTPLIWAAAKSRVSAVRRLLELGAGVNVRGTGWAAHNGQIAALDLLS